MGRPCRTIVAAALLLVSCPTRARAQEAEDSFWDLDLDIGSGIAYIVDEPFWNMTAMANLRIWQVQAALTAPVNLSLIEWNVREEDWDESYDYQRIVSCVRADMAWEYNEETGSREYVEIHRFPMLRERGECGAWPLGPRSRFLSARLATVDAVTLGPGNIMDGFTNDLDVDH